MVFPAPTIRFALKPSLACPSVSLGAPVGEPANQADLAALANAEIAKAKAEGKELPRFGAVYGALCLAHPDAARVSPLQNEDVRS